MLERRERKILDTLKKIPKEKVILIGAYAVNTYVPPRFSMDCDLLVLDESERLEEILMESGFKKAGMGEVPYGKYHRFVDPVQKVSFDILINSVLDRRSGISFSSRLIKERSSQRVVVGKASPIRIKMKIADPELLFVMKFVCCRKQDIRDIFMLSRIELDWGLIKEILFKKCSREILKERKEEIKKAVKSRFFRDSLQGAFGAIPTETFIDCKKDLLNFLKDLV